MDNKMQIFESKEFGNIRVVEIDGQPWFVGKDVTDILGYGNGSRDLNRHVDSDDRQNYRNGTFETSNRGISVINESGLYSLILSSKLPAARSFKRWVTSEILPSIRKHGAYVTDEVLRRLKEDSEFADVLVERLTAEKMKNHALTDQVRQLTPKAQYCDLILQNPGAVQVSIIAHDYGLSATAFNKLLHALGIQHKVGNTWLLYAEHAGNGYTVTRTYHVNSYTTAIWTCFTQRGRLWLYKLLKCHGIVPETERPAACS